MCMRLATTKQVLALSRVFAPRYTDWKNWASVNLSFEDAHRLISVVHGHYAVDISNRKEDAIHAYEVVRIEAKKLGFRYA